MKQSTKRVFLIWNDEKPDAAGVLQRVRDIVALHAAIVGEVTAARFQEAPAGVDRIIMIGGDGTLLGVARALGSKPIPLIGVNAGKLGYLAEFSLGEIETDIERLLSDDSLISRRMFLQVEARREGAVVANRPAINDCVIQAGPPFRMITLGVDVNGEHLTDITGDGIIVSTPSGSTAHNLSAGGPIMQPDVDALILTPLCPHSLTHKPLVVAPDSEIEIRAEAVNDGTTVILDGQVSFPLRRGDHVLVRKASTDFLLVRNPRYGKWRNLITKLHWGQPPSNP
ncbi:MAG: NAD(+)/NADH kinase [Planctomycetes bacterium]|nr:NAD(+)/NADH kinase [Planctomycetota bacterium]MBI3833525.1 NAD(+)/NADH kinase [Planctomycetota bacterium]